MTLISRKILGINFPIFIFMKYDILSATVWLFFSLLLNKVNSQASTIVQYTFQAGSKCPDFDLGRIESKNNLKVSTQDFRGKWLILDFWNKYCTACVKSFPFTNEMQKRFAGKVEFLIIGKEDPENQIRSMYARFEKRLNLELNTIFDSVLFKKFDIGPCPYVVVVNPDGIIKAVTVGVDDKRPARGSDAADQIGFCAVRAGVGELGRAGLGGHAELLGHLAFLIGQQREVELVDLLEQLVVLD